MTTANETLTLFTEEPLAPAQPIPQAELDYNAAFRLRFVDILRQRKIAEIGSECEIRGIPVRYQGVLITQVGQAWQAVHVETVIWQEARAA